MVVIFRFLTFKELKALTTKYKINKINLSGEAVDYIFKVISNLIEAFKRKIIPHMDYQIFSKLFHILKLLNLSQEQFSLIYETFDHLLKKYNNSIEYAQINAFVYHQFNYRNASFKSDELEKLIRTICTVASHDTDNTYSNYYMDILKSLVIIFNKVESNRPIIFNDNEMTLLLCSRSDDALISIYPVCTKTFQNKIQKHLLKSLRQNKSTKTYYDALIQSIIKPIKEYENKLYTIANGTNNTYENNMAYCANLLFEKKIIDREKFIDLIKQDKSLSMIIDPENYDYRNFNPSLLYSLTCTALELISSNEKAYESIHMELKKYLSTNYEDKLAKIYIKYFSK